MSRPASSPRRWPDLLIGLLVALLLVGFGLLLFKPGGRPVTTAGTSETTSAPPASAATTIPAAPDITSTEVPGATPSGNEPSGEASGTAAQPAEPPTIAAAPVTAQPTAPAAEAGSTAEDVAAQNPATPAAEPVASSSAPRSGGAVATSERRVPLRSDYRITLGTFSSESAAQSGTSGVSGLGYTVYPIDLGSQVVAQVGPFADEASARQALADIQRAYPRAILYPPRNRSLSGDSSAPASATSSSTTTEAATPAPAPSGPTYLQVGAFDRAESAQRLVGRLRDLGYAPSVNAPEGRKVTVVVGPFSGDALTRTESRLSSNGLDHFRVR